MYLFSFTIRSMVRSWEYTINVMSINQLFSKHLYKNHIWKLFLPLFNLSFHIRMIKNVTLKFPSHYWYSVYLTQLIGTITNYKSWKFSRDSKIIWRLFQHCKLLQISFFIFRIINKPINTRKLGGREFPVFVFVISFTNKSRYFWNE